MQGKQMILLSVDIRTCQAGCRAGDLKQVRISMAAQLGFTAHQHLGDGEVAMAQGSSQSCPSPSVCHIHIGVIPAHITPE